MAAPRPTAPNVGINNPQRVEDGAAKAMLAKTRHAYGIAPIVIDLCSISLVNTTYATAVVGWSHKRGPSRLTTLGATIVASVNNKYRVAKLALTSCVSDTTVDSRAWAVLNAQKTRKNPAPLRSE